jgi:hypothetical protein
VRVRVTAQAGPVEEGDLSVTEIWVSEHYWPGMAAELVTAHAQRLARAAGAVATVVLPGEQTAFGLHVAHRDQDVRRALAAVGLGTAVVGAGWLLRPPDRT